MITEQGYEIKFPEHHFNIIFDGLQELKQKQVYAFTVNKITLKKLNEEISKEVKNFPESGIKSWEGIPIYEVEQEESIIPFYSHFELKEYFESKGI